MIRALGEGFPDTDRDERRQKTTADSNQETVKKNIRVRPEQWERLERAAEGTALTANQLVMALAIEALDRCERPQGGIDLRVARASLFAAQVLARDLIAAGRENDIEEVRSFISTIVPDRHAQTG